MKIIKNYFLFACLISITSATYPSSLKNKIGKFTIITPQSGKMNCNVYDATNSKNQDLDNKVHFARTIFMYNIINTNTFKQMVKNNTTHHPITATVHDMKHTHSARNILYEKEDGTKAPAKYRIMFAINIQ